MTMYNALEKYTQLLGSKPESIDGLPVIKEHNEWIPVRYDPGDTHRDQVNERRVMNKRYENVGKKVNYSDDRGTITTKVVDGVKYGFYKGSWVLLSSIIGVGNPKR